MRNRCWLSVAGPFLCSKQDSPVFQAGHSVCSKQDSPCVRSKTFLVFEARHSVCYEQDNSFVPITKKCTCHFLVNSADRPEIWANRNQIRTNPKTIDRIRQKMACEIFELRRAQKSRGWLRFRRFSDENDRDDTNFFFEIFTSSKFLSRRQKNSRRTNARTN